MKDVARDGSRRIRREEIFLVTWRYIGVACHGADYKSYTRIFKTTWQGAISGDESSSKASSLPTPEGSDVQNCVRKGERRHDSLNSSPSYDPVCI
jgi:hypothetical protein